MAGKRRKYLGALVILGVLGTLTVVSAMGALDTSSQANANLYAGSVGDPPSSAASNAVSPCATKQFYRIGHLDPRFGLDQEIMQGIASDAAALWNKAIGQDVLVYSPTAPMAINLVYDQRQQALDDTDTATQHISLLKSQVDTMDAQIEQSSADLSRAEDQYNADVNLWNIGGGAPPGIYEQLQQTKTNLSLQSAELSALVTRRNALAATENQSIRAMPKGDTTETMGLFTSGGGQVPTIDLFLYMNGDQLRWTLAHEFGHALGLGHVDDIGSVMAPTDYDSEHALTAALQLSGADLRALKVLCGSVR
jgi:hypothetical protein